MLCLVVAASACSSDQPTTTESTTTAPTTTTSAPTTTTAATTTTATTEPPDLFSQAADRTRPEARTSQIANQSGLPPTIVLDDFSIADGGTVVGLRWQGIYCIEEEGAPSPVPTGSGFVIGVYPDQDGDPAVDSPLLDITLDVAQVNETPLDTSTDLQCGGTTSTWDFYQYAAVLAEPFTAEAGARYWISVQAVTPTYETFWGWVGSSDGDGRSLQEYAGTVTEQNLDRTFTLTDQGV